MFTDVSYTSGVALPSFPLVKWGDAFVDLDNDGWLDLVAVSGHVYPQMEKVPASGGYAQTKLLHMNQKDGTFCDAGNLAGPALEERRVSRGLAVGDLFNDGNVDVVVEGLDSGPMILQNHGVSCRRWGSLTWAAAETQLPALPAAW